MKILWREVCLNIRSVSVSIKKEDEKVFSDYGTAMNTLFHEVLVLAGVMFMKNNSRRNGL